MWRIERREREKKKGAIDNSQKEGPFVVLFFLCLALFYRCRPVAFTSTTDRPITLVVLHPRLIAAGLPNVTLLPTFPFVVWRCCSSCSNLAAACP